MDNPKNKPVMIIVRGAPGSGKSTYAMKNFPWYCHFETDQYFMNKYGAYEFDRNKLSENHDKCFNAATHAMNSIAEGLTKVWEGVVVTNTFTKLWEMERYLKFCKLNNYPVRVIHLKTQYGNTHRVPKNVVDSMIDKFEEFVGEEEIG